MSAAKTFVFAALAACFNPTPHLFANGHGYLETPRSRNVKAYNLAYLCTQSTAGPGCPKPEYCPHCLNTNLGVCGKFGSNSYETSTWVDTKSNPMPFTPEETYLEGDIIMVKSYLDTHHNGHMELKACNKGPANCKQEDFDAPGNELIFIEDMVFQGNHVKMPADPNYPGRGMYGGGQGGQTKTFVFKYKLPEGLYGDQVLLQWRYITANSCSPPGYENYFSTNSYLPDSYWTRGLTECVLPYHSDGSRDSTSPEQFWNCAEVKILPSSSRSPTVSPKPTKSPTTAAPVSSRPSMPPGICIAEWKDCTSDQSSCCEGFKCTQVDPTGSSLCLADTCSWNPPPPTPSTPAPTTPKTPTTASPHSNSGCCTINLKTCHHEAGTFCALSKENCEGPCGKLWLENGELDGCTAMWEPCNTSDECCQHAICDNGSCNSDDPYLKKGSSPPTVKPTPTPTNRPTTLVPTTPKICNLTATHVKLEATTSQNIHVFEVQVFSSGNNVAINKNAFQSSTFGALSASRAIDGDPLSFSHTNDGNAWWEVDLVESYSVDSVHIKNRWCKDRTDPSDCLCRLSNATLSLINDVGSVVASRSIGRTCGLPELTFSFDASSSYCITKTPTKSPTIKSTKSPTTLSPATSPPTKSPVTPTPTSPTVTNPPTRLAPVTSAPQGQAFPAHESEFVRVNQMGYLMFAQKIGVVVDSSTSPLAWQIQDTSGFVVLNGVTTVYGHDDASDDHVHHADFSSLREIGSYRLVVNSIGASLTFKIAPSLYPELPHDAMNYFYFHRMGQEIPGKHLVDARYARPALHLGDSSLPPYPGWCNTCSNFDLRGSWADAGDFGIYTVNHAISAWTLLNLHELFPDAFVDGELNIDESGNSFPDVLDEVDYGSRFVRGMLPSDGGLASHKAHNHVWSAFPTTITDENNQQRSVMGSSTPATYAVARVNAHLARLWSSRGGDTVYSSMLWDAAIDAWSRADGTSKAYNANEASPGTGGGDYPDSMFDDDRYAAACEMYLTAFGLGDQSAETYKIAMMSSSYYKKIDQWDWATVYGAGTLSLYAAESDLSSTDKASIETNIVAFADKITQAVDNEGYPSNLGFPNEFSRYPWGSNSFIMNRAVVLAYAYEITGNVSYQNYLLRSMDYIMGVNAMGISYVTGYGEKSETDTHDRLAWAVGQDVFWPKGWLSGGPNNELINDSATPSGAAAKSYAGRGTAPQAWCSKENTINWNAPLAWVAWYIENKVVPNLGGCGEENCQPIANSLTGIKVNMDSWTSVLLTATDYDGVVASWEIVSLPQMGILSGSSPNLVYTPNSGFIGSDSFQFRVYDDSGNVSETALVEFIVQDCNFISKFEVPSDFPAFSGSYKYVHVSEDGPNLVEMRTPAHNVQWANPGLYQFSLEMNASPYYKDLSQCMTSQTLSDPTSAGFTLINCGISGLDGDYWVTQKDGNEIWVEKNNLWVIVFTNDVNYSPEFCRSSEGVSRVPTRNPTTLGPVSSNPTGLAHSTKPTLPTTSSPTMRPTSKGTAAPSSKSPSVAPNSSAGFGCYERNTGYQQRKADPWCNSQETNCGACAGLWLKNPLQRNGCCKWNPNDDCTAVDPNIQTKLASI